jgi:hypothetical protein
MISKSILGLSFGLPWVAIALIWRDASIKTARENSHAWYSESLGKYGPEMYRFKRDSIREVRRMKQIQADMQRRKK